ncbi:hypothetical protein AL538_21220 [Vibrio harveyi]|uniref:Uncharacterized protein n=1 Tax=Vibrio harveyi TaxID=669 RepID=A0ABN4L6P3_VIBHA|nr:hypothetical protein AL538_21220 [Vibrio harveyi]
MFELRRVVLRKGTIHKNLTELKQWMSFSEVKFLESMIKQVTPFSSKQIEIYSSIVNKYAVLEIREETIGKEPIR